MYRVSKGTNSFKEIMQVGLECIGAVTDKEIAVVVPAKIIWRNFINVPVTFKLHFSVRCNFEILKSNSFSCFNWAEVLFTI